MTEADIQRDLGGLEADMKTVKAQLTEMSKKLDSMAICLASAKGGYKALLGVGALAGVIGGFVVKLLPFVGAMR